MMNTMQIVYLNLMVAYYYFLITGKMNTMMMITQTITVYLGHITVVMDRAILVVIEVIGPMDVQLIPEEDVIKCVYFLCKLF